MKINLEDLRQVIEHELNPQPPLLEASDNAPLYEKLVAELIRDDSPVPVPVDFALEQVFADIGIDEFCNRFHLQVRQVNYYFGRYACPRAFYEFSWKDES